MAKKTVDFKEAKKVAKELNDLMDLDPAIKVTQGKDDLNKDLKKAAGFLEPSDELSKMARKVLTTLGVKLEDDEEEEPEEDPEEEPEEDPEEEPEEDPEEEIEEEEDEDDEYADMDRSELKKAIRASKVKKVKEMKVFKSTSDDDLREALRGTAGKKDPKENEGGMTRSKKGKGTDTKKDKDKASKTRAEIFKALMDDGGGTKKALVKGMQKKYKGGESSESEAQFQVGLFVRLLETMGFVNKNDDDEYVLAE